MAEFPELSLPDRPVRFLVEILHAAAGSAASGLAATRSKRRSLRRARRGSVRKDQRQRACRLERAFLALQQTDGCEAGAFAVGASGQPSPYPDGSAHQEDSKKDRIPGLTRPTQIRLVRKYRREGRERAKIDQQPIPPSNSKPQHQCGSNPDGAIGAPIEPSPVGCRKQTRPLARDDEVANQIEARKSHSLYPVQVGLFKLSGVEPLRVAGNEKHQREQTQRQNTFGNPICSQRKWRNTQEHSSNDNGVSESEG